MGNFTSQRCEDPTADSTKLDYLGRGVDCRQSSDTWLKKLDNYGAEKVRELDPNNKNMKIKPVSKRETLSCENTTETKKGMGGKINAMPHQSVKLYGELVAKQDTSKYTKCKIEYQSTRIVTMLDDTSLDPHIIIRKDPPTHYTKYEKELSQSILEHIKGMQTKAGTNGGEESRCLGKMIKDLKDDNPVARLEEYLQYARSEKELCQQIWQTLANACCCFIKDEKPFTHYVKSITLGATQQESYESQDSSRDISGGVHLSGFNVIDGSIRGGQQATSKSAVTRNQARGEIDDSGAVITEEVIEACMAPVSSLINEKSQELKTIMKRLLQCYSCPNHGKSVLRTIIQYSWN